MLNLINDWSQQKDKEIAWFFWVLFPLDISIHIDAFFRREPGFNLSILVVWNNWWSESVGELFVEIPVAANWCTLTGLTEIRSAFISGTIKLWGRDINISILDPCLDKVNCIYRVISLIWCRMRSSDDCCKSKILSNLECLFEQRNHDWWRSNNFFDVKDNSTVFMLLD